VIHSMTRMRLVIGFVFLLSLARCQHTANAAFHLWQITEVYSNADGSVQFIEMFDQSAFEQFVDGQVIRAESDGVSKDFIFPDNLNTFQTANHHLLIATPGFAALPGAVAPDFDLVSSDPQDVGPFFDPNAASITITFFGSGSTASFSGTSFPKDGVHSLSDPDLSGGFVSSVNSPTNFNGDEGLLGSSGPSPTGDYNGNHVDDGADYVVWRNTLGQSATPSGSGADGDQSGMIDAGDYTYWRQRFGDTVPGAGGGSGQLSVAGVPEPSVECLLTWCLLALARRRK